MRSKAASDGICISISFHRIEPRAKNITQPDSDETQDDGQNDVPSSIEPFAVAHQIEGLEAEGGECGVSAANTVHKKLAAGRADESAAARFSQCQKKPDGER